MADDIHITQVTARTLAASLQVCIDARVPAFVWGSPGIGKSDIVRQLAGQLGALLIDIRASQWDAVDTRGVPFIDGETRGDGRTRAETAVTRWAVPSVFPTAEEAAQHPLVIIFLDELNAAPPSVQAALYQLVLNRRLGDYVLPDNVVILAAGNAETDRAVTHRMSTALAGRFVHFQLVVDAESWERWALGAGMHIAPIAYMRWVPKALHEFDPRSSSKAQPTPRTWEFVSRLVTQCEARGAPRDVELALLCGAVGGARGAEFAGFLRIFRSLPDPAAVIMAPDAAAISEDPAVTWALCGALAEKATPANVDRILRYAERLRDAPSAGPEMMTLLARAMAVRNPDVQSTRGFIAWAANNSEVLL